MEFIDFKNKIKNFLNSKDIIYKNFIVGRIRTIDEKTAVLYFTEDIFVYFNDNKQCIDIQFILNNDEYVLKEMTIEIDSNSYGYKHCKPEGNVFPLYTKLDEEVCDKIIDYINNVNNLDIKGIEYLYSKSLTRTTYKKHFPNFYTDNTKYISIEDFEKISNEYDVYYDGLGEMYYICNNGE